MEVSELLSRCREHLPSLPGVALLSQIRCQMELQETKHEDTNAAFRYAVLKELNLTLTQA